MTRDEVDLLVEDLTVHFNTHGWDIDLYHSISDRTKLVKIARYVMSKMPYLRLNACRHLLNIRPLVFYSTKLDTLYVDYEMRHLGDDVPLGPL